jgi:hypothetical protein
MKIDPVKKAPVPAISGEDLIVTVPQIGKVATIEVENLSNVPSDYKARIVLEEGVSRAESDNLFRSRSRSGNRRRSLS